MIPSSRAEFKGWCLRSLGVPVVRVNVDDDQVEDRIDYALKYYWDYHFDGSQKVFYKHMIQANNRPQVVYEFRVLKSGVGYSNSDTLILTAPRGGDANGTIVTDANGSILRVNTTAIGHDYGMPPSVGINTSGGSGANVEAVLGGFIPLPDNIIGAVNIFDLGNAIGVNNIFNMRYQIALNDLYSLTSVELVPYYMAMSHIQFLEMMLVGKQPLRYNRHMNRLYIDGDWSILAVGNWIVVEAYSVVDPEQFPKAWGDRWLLRYATAQIKRQWGENLKKYAGMSMPGGVQFNGQTIWDEATAEITMLEREMLMSYSLPAADMIG